MYHGAMSIVYHAIDKSSGITVALKLYKRQKLGTMERHQVGMSVLFWEKVWWPSTGSTMHEREGA